MIINDTLIYTYYDCMRLYTSVILLYAIFFPVHLMPHVLKGKIWCFNDLYVRYICQMLDTFGGLLSTKGA